VNLHLYAVADAAAFEALEGLALIGVSAAPVRAQRLAGLTVLVSETDASPGQDAAFERQTALQHHAVVEAAMAVAPLLPARHSPAVRLELLTGHLSQHREAYLARLVSIGDAREFGVRAELPSPSATTSSRTASREAGATYLRARQAQFQMAAARRTELEALAAGVEARLSAVTLDARRTFPDDSVYRGSFLVRRIDLERASRLGAEVTHDLWEVSASWHGPFPPYSFAVLT
jgi:Gas vesicle synthesis protein GvpL/GvpF